MLGCIQPMSSPMMNMMLGFASCAIALELGSADAVANAASAAPAAKRLRLRLIFILLSDWHSEVPSTLRRRDDAPAHGPELALFFAGETVFATSTTAMPPD